MELGMVVGVAVFRGGGLKGAAVVEAAEAVSISPDKASIRVSSVTAARLSRTNDAGDHRVNRFINGLLCSQ